MEKSVEIKELKLKLGKKEIMLSIEEARKLKSALEEVFGRNIIKEVEHHYDRYPYRWYWHEPYLLSTTSEQFEFYHIDCADNCSLSYKDNQATLSIC